MGNKELAKGLKEYFKKYPDYVRQSVWDVIKSHLVAMDRWKNLQRGDPKKGYKKGYGRDKLGY